MIEKSLPGNMPERPVLFKDLPVYKDNPFIEGIFGIKTKKKTVQISRTPNALIDENGNHTGDSYMCVKRNVDKEEFVKIFKNQLSIVFDLTKTAQKILTYLIKMLEVNKDFIVFDRDDAKLYSGLSSDASIYSGLAELIRNGVIAKSMHNAIYFINPAILFNGDRLTVISRWERDDHMQPGKNIKEDWSDEPENKSQGAIQA